MGRNGVYIISFGIKKSILTLITIPDGVIPSGGKKNKIKGWVTHQNCSNWLYLGGQHIKGKLIRGETLIHFFAFKYILQW